MLHGLPARLPMHFKALWLSGLQLSYKQPLHPWSMLWVGAVVSQEPRIHCVPRVSSCLTLPPGNRKSLSWTVLRAVCKLFSETMADDSSGTVINNLQACRLTDLPKIQKRTFPNRIVYFFSGGLQKSNLGLGVLVIKWLHTYACPRSDSKRV